MSRPASVTGRNPFLMAGAALTALASLAHLACIVIGAPAYLAMGAGSRMARLAEAGHWYPPSITVIIAGVLGVWSVYALSGAGLVQRLPLLRPVLAAVGIALLLRSVARPVIEPWFPGNSDLFWLLSSGICALTGACYLVGLARMRS